MSEKINVSVLTQIMKEIRWYKDGLIPAVVQDMESGEVLLLAYMNEEALKKTLTEGKACFFSRSRNSLWLKGETSGNFQEVADICFDCDKDSVLLKVKQTGMACHENFFSCFHYCIAPDDPEPQKGQSPWTQLGEPDRRPAVPLGRTLEILAETISRGIWKDRKALTPHTSSTRAWTRSSKKSAKNAPK
jgi:phosphoribosyl-ATP pyrophosphohydrolase/phosphoribosyl-AMP cyclohydrolase